MMDLLFIYLIVIYLIVIIVIVGVVIAYFMLGNKSIKDGNYVFKEGGANIFYMKVSKDNFEFGNYVNNLPNKKTEFKLIKTDMTFKINEKEVPVFESSIPIDDKIFYFAQSLIDDNIYMLYKGSNGTLIKFVVLAPSQTL